MHRQDAALHIGGSWMALTTGAGTSGKQTSNRDNGLTKEPPP